VDQTSGIITAWLQVRVLRGPPRSSAENGFPRDHQESALFPRFKLAYGSAISLSSRKGRSWENLPCTVSRRVGGVSRRISIWRPETGSQGTETQFGAYGVANEIRGKRESRFRI